MIRLTSELAKFREGEIFVARELAADWRCYLSAARAVLYVAPECDDLAASLQVELNIPVLRIEEAGWWALRSGDIIHIQADGEILRQDDRRSTDSPMRISVPVAAAARFLAGDSGLEEQGISQLSFLPQATYGDPTDESQITPDHGPDPQSDF